MEGLLRIVKSGGGAFLGFLPKFRTCQESILCHNSDTYHHKMTESIMTRHHGFTLAEVLITLGIIGVVAAITLPVLIQNYQKQVTAEGVKKAYSELNQVIEMAKADYGDPSGWDYYEQENLAKWVQTYIEPYVNVIGRTTCGTNQRCLGLALYYPLKFSKPGSGNTNIGQYIITKPGVPVAYAFFRYGGVYEPVTRVRVYIRNPKKYAFIGKDVFTFILDKREPSPFFRSYVPHNYNFPKYTYDRNAILGTGWGACNPKASGSGYWGPGDACSGLIMLDGWKISKDYPW